MRAMSIGAIDCVDVARPQADASQRQRLADTLYHAAEALVVEPDIVAALASLHSRGSILDPVMLEAAKR